MKNRSRVIGLSFFAVWILLAAIGAYVIKWAPGNGSGDAAGIRIFGITVGPAAFVGFLIVLAILIIAVCIRLFAVPKFGYVPGRLQAFLEGTVNFFKRKPRKKRENLMTPKVKRISIIVCAVWIIGSLIGTIVFKGIEKEESLAVMMRDAVMHDVNKVNFFGLAVNPSVLSGFIVTIAILVIALILRIFVVPRFKLVPGKVQLVIEMLVSFFSGQAHTRLKKLNHFLGAYMMAAGCFIFIGTISELFGIQLVTTTGSSIAMPAPVSDINCAICYGVMSYLVIMACGIIGNGIKGVGYTLKEFSLPISMSFRLFGALLSGLLVTELVYFVIMLSYVLPVLVGILFTCIHAIMQTYIICMLVSMYSAEVSELKPKKEKKKKVKKSKKNKNIQIPTGAEA